MGRSKPLRADETQPSVTIGNTNSITLCHNTVPALALSFNPLSIVSSGRK